MIPAGTNELTRLERWLYGRLTGSADLVAIIGANVYPAPAPDPLEDLTPGLLEDTAVVFQFLAAPADDQPIDASSGARVLARPLFLVKAVGPQHVDLEPVADALELVLAGAQGEVDGLAVTCARDLPVYYPEVAAGGRLYTHLGAQWRLEIG